MASKRSESVFKVKNRYYYLNRQTSFFSTSKLLHEATLCGCLIVVLYRTCAFVMCSHSNLEQVLVIIILPLLSDTTICTVTITLVWHYGIKNVKKDINKYNKIVFKKIKATYKL